MKNISFYNQIGGGSHLPILSKIVNMTQGPILELGSGLFSTPYLHWVCYDSKRKLVTYENKQEYYRLFDFHDTRESGNDYSFHEIIFVQDNKWNDIDLSGHWSVALIDHNPRPRRKEEVRKLSNSADYIILHDTDEKDDYYYKYSEIFPLFKYRYDYKKACPQTTVVSNFVDLSNL